MSCFSLNEICVDGTGHKIAMSISVEKQLSLPISLGTKMILAVGQVLLTDQFCNTIHIMENTTSCYVFRQS